MHFANFVSDLNDDRCPRAQSNDSFDLAFGFGKVIFAMVLSILSRLVRREILVTVHDNDNNEPLAKLVLHG